MGVQSPLNYTGGKFRLLSQLFSIFPTAVSGKFYDIFAGGFNVSANVPYSSVVANDLNQAVVELMGVFARLDGTAILSVADTLLARYGLSDTASKSYAHYGADGSNGLADVNRAGYVSLREDFNKGKFSGDAAAIALLVLGAYGFNNQLRWNRSGAFNTPVGKRDLNPAMRTKVRDFAKLLHGKELDLSTLDFEVAAKAAQPGDFVYADPPYLVTTATYNEGGGWTEDDERRLLALLDWLDGEGVPFALSNVLCSRGRTNAILTAWLRVRPNYQVHHLAHSYQNSNYQIKNRAATSSEVLVTNFA